MNLRYACRALARQPGFTLQTRQQQGFAEMEASWPTVNDWAQARGFTGLRVTPRGPGSWLRRKAPSG